jgi:hypothetical protein
MFFMVTGTTVTNPLAWRLGKIVSCTLIGNLPGTMPASTVAGAATPTAAPSFGTVNAIGPFTTSQFTLRPGTLVTTVTWAVAMPSAARAAAPFGATATAERLIRGGPA